jgi:hypothetical protein
MAVGKGIEISHPSRDKCGLRNFFLHVPLMRYQEVPPLWKFLLRPDIAAQATVLTQHSSPRNIPVMASGTN